MRSQAEIAEEHVVRCEKLAADAYEQGNLTAFDIWIKRADEYRREARRVRIIAEKALRREEEKHA